MVMSQSTPSIIYFFVIVGSMLLNCNPICSIIVIVEDMFYIKTLERVLHERGMMVIVCL